MNQVTLLLFLVIIVAKISLAFNNEINHLHHIDNQRKNVTSSSVSCSASRYSTACYPTKTYHHTMQYINVTKTHCWKKTITQTISPTGTIIVPTCTKYITKVPVNTKKETRHPHLKTTSATTTTTKKNAHRSIAKAKSRSKAISKSKSRAASKSKSRAASKSKSRAAYKSKSKSASKSKSKSKSKSVHKSRSKAISKSKFKSASKLKSLSVSKSKSRSKYTSKSRSQSRSLAKSRQIHSSSRMKATTETQSTTTAVPATTVPQVALPTETSVHQESTTDYNTDNESTATDDSTATVTTTIEETTTTTESIFTPTSSSIDPPVLAAPTNNPNDLYNNPDVTAGNDIGNKALGIGLGVGIGCIAALGLAGLLVHNRKKQQQSPLNEEAASTVPTRWRPQSFMGVVASVVSKLPRSPSQRSKASTNMLGGIGTGTTTGVAVGHGEGAVEDVQQRRQY